MTASISSRYLSNVSSTTFNVGIGEDPRKPAAQIGDEAARALVHVVLRVVHPAAGDVEEVGADKPYVFSCVNTRNPNSYPSKATDGSGRSKLNV